jgi:hypothetical protein
MFSISKRYVDNSKFLSAVPADTKSGNFVSAIRRHIFVDISFAMLKSMMGAGSKPAKIYDGSGPCIRILRRVCGAATMDRVRLHASHAQQDSTISRSGQHLYTMQCV